MKYALNGNVARIRIGRLNYRHTALLLVILKEHPMAVCPFLTTAKTRQIVKRVTIETDKFSSPRETKPTHSLIGSTGQGRFLSPQVRYSQQIPQRRW